jgi:hypothetical protein
MELETGRISEQEFETAEKALLDRLEGIDNRLREEEDPGQLDSLETQGELGGTEGTGGPS